MKVLNTKGSVNTSISNILFQETESKNFAVIDGAMNDIIRPALYQAVMNIVPVLAAYDAPDPGPGGCGRREAARVSRGRRGPSRAPG